MSNFETLRLGLSFILNLRLRMLRPLSQMIIETKLSDPTSLESRVSGDDGSRGASKRRTEQ